MLGRLAQTSVRSLNLVNLFIRSAKNSEPNKASVWEKLHVCVCVCVCVCVGATCRLGMLEMVSTNYFNIRMISEGSCDTKDWNNSFICLN